MTALTRRLLLAGVSFAIWVLAVVAVALFVVRVAR